MEIKLDIWVNKNGYKSMVIEHDTITEEEIIEYAKKKYEDYYDGDKVDHINIDKVII